MMKKQIYSMVIKLISYLGLVMSLVPGFLVFAGKMEFETYKGWILAGTIVWFVTAPFWINKKSLKELENKN